MRDVTPGGPVILVIEDEPSIADAVAARLRSEGFDVDVATDGPSGVERCNELQPALVILDLMLPGLDGLEVCKQIQRDRSVPVLMLTARDDEADVLIGLAVGADDYMTKPFSPRELVARVRTILRRVGRTGEPTTGDTVTVGNVDLDRAARRVQCNGVDVHLTSTEFDLLWFLAERSGAVFPREQLLAEVWGYRDGSGARTVDSHVRAVRRKLGADVIRTVHGFGYGIGPGD